MSLPFFSFFSRVAQDFRSRFEARPLGRHEGAVHFHQDTREVEIVFFASRRPVAFHLRASVSQPTDVVRVDFELGQPQDFTVTRQRSDGAEELVVALVRTEATRRVVLVLDIPRDDWEASITGIRVLKDDDPDLYLLGAAGRLEGEGRVAETIDKLHRYEDDYSPENPFVSLWLARLCRRRGLLDRAGEEAVKTLRHGSPEAAAELYREIQDERPAIPVETIRLLQEEARSWDLGPLHGVVTLRRCSHVALGLNGFVLRRRHELLEIRRPAAARLLEHVGFRFSTADQTLLHTRLSVLHPDGRVENVPEEQFAVRDLESHDVAITTRREKGGFWILPDLVSGDVVSFSFDLAQRSRQVSGVSQEFALAGLFNEYFPTLRGTLEISAPSGIPITAAFRNMEPQWKEQRVDDRSIRTIVGTRFEPIRRTGLLHADNFLNPLVACARKGLSWKDVARDVRRASIGEPENEAGLPEPLREVVRGCSDPTAALRRAFYWIRDKIRYGSVPSGQVRVRHADRGRQIVEAGLGDCKDKSYLLALVCRELGIPCEFLAVSTRNGILIEETPADQFDHVFVRVRPGDSWLYLDAASGQATFGAPPAWCQGLSALLLDDDASLIELPTAAPESNALEISETLERVQEGRLHGRFRIRARGLSARLGDELWKSISLNMEDDREAASEALRHFLPGCVTTTCTRRADTSESDEFQVEGEHSRGPLAGLGRDGRAACALTWNIPFLEIRGRHLPASPRLELPLVFALTIVTTVRGEARAATRDVSRLVPLETSIGSAAEECVEEPDALTLRRTILLKKRLLLDEDARELPRMLAHLDQALHAVLICDATPAPAVDPLRCS
ncbi:MAG: transglutaminase domain-containing protein [bacterium]